MIVHVVLFEPRADLSQGRRQQVLDQVRDAAASIPSVRRCRIGRRIRHGLPGYEQSMREAYSFAAIFEFEDRAGLTAYLQHPGHAAIGHHFGASAARALAYDYDMTDAKDVDGGSLTADY